MDGPKDWQTGQRPLTCCHKIRENTTPPEGFHCNNAEPGEEILYSDGCLDKLKMKVNSNAKILIGVGIGIAFIEVRKPLYRVIYKSRRKIFNESFKQNIQNH